MKTSRIFLISLAASLALVGCGSDPGFNEDTDFVRKEGAVQFVNMIADSPELTMIHGLTNQTIRFPFTSGIDTRFEDRYDWRLAFRKSNLDEVTVAEAEDQQILENTLSTFLLMGTINQPNVQIIDVPISPIEERTEGSALIWFAANLSAISMVDLYLINSGALLGESAPLISLDSGNFTNALTVDSGNEQRLIITVAGSQDVVFDSGQITLADKSIDLFALVDDFGPEGTSRVDVIRSNSETGSIMPDIGQATAARVINYSSLEPLDVVIADTIISAANTGLQTDYRPTSGGSQNIRINQDNETLFEESAELFGGGFHSLLVFDTNDSESSLKPILVRDEFRAIKERVYFQFINGSAETIDLYALISDQEIDDTAPILRDAGSVASGIGEVPIGETRFVIRTADNQETLGSTQLTLQEGNTYTLIYEGNAGLQAVVN